MLTHLTLEVNTVGLGGCNFGERIMSTNKAGSHKSGRDARTGEFIPVKEAQRRSSTAVVETIKHPTPQRTGGKKK